MDKEIKSYNDVADEPLKAYDAIQALRAHVREQDEKLTLLKLQRETCHADCKEIADLKQQLAEVTAEKHSLQATIIKIQRREAGLREIVKLIPQELRVMNEYGLDGQRIVAEETFLGQSATQALDGAGGSPWIEVTPETMPKTQQRVQVFYVNSNGKTRYTIADYIAPKTVLEEDYLSEECSPDFAEYDEEKDCYWTPAGWYESSWESEQNWQITDKVLFWMPKPALPSLPEGGEGDKP
jgi:hypothetical protein